MDGDRKYRQHGYQDSSSASQDKPRHFERSPEGGGPKQKISNGPRLPRLVAAVSASRCWNCATAVNVAIDAATLCPKCQKPLHVCKQCSYFDSSARLQCLKAIPERIAYKDQPNSCAFFGARVTVARDNTPASFQTSPAPTAGFTQAAPEPRTPRDARTAFDNLFKK